MIKIIYGILVLLFVHTIKLGSISLIFTNLFNGIQSNISIEIVIVILTVLTFFSEHLLLFSGNNSDNSPPNEPEPSTKGGKHVKDVYLGTPITSDTEFTLGDCVDDLLYDKQLTLDDKSEGSGYAHYHEIKFQPGYVRTLGTILWLAVIKFSLYRLNQQSFPINTRFKMTVTHHSLKMRKGVAISQSRVLHKPLIVIPGVTTVYDLFLGVYLSMSKFDKGNLKLSHLNSHISVAYTLVKKQQSKNKK